MQIHQKRFQASVFVQEPTLTGARLIEFLARPHKSTEMSLKLHDNTPLITLQYLGGSLGAGPRESTGVSSLLLSVRGIG